MLRERDMLAGAHVLRRWYGLGCTGILVFCTAIFTGPVAASSFDVTIDSTALNGVDAVLVFDFIDGGPPDNAVTLSALTSNGTQGSASSMGNVSGSGPWTFSDAGSSFFNELQLPYNPMGSSLSFSFTTTDNPPDPGSVPDGFSFFILGTDALTPLITTDGPADALFLDSIGQGLSVYTPDQTSFSIQVTPAQSAPEPVSLALLAAGLVALSARRRFTR
jgi:hypothetical protein